ncbi:MAG: hypothetical protein FJY85_18190, partial [Deltaproteobacteria bacterium]|nr:hypothetical protein [Deltaproteobacteria bacterium]
MGKPTIEAKEAVRDVRSGMDAEALMKKYGLAPVGLTSLLTKLVNAGLLTQSEMDAVIRRPEAAAVEAWKCPACGAAQPEKPYVCPQCGVIVAKYEKRQAELGGLPTARSEADQQRGPQPDASRPGQGTKTRSCPFCKQEIEAEATRCNHCGEWIRASFDVRVREEPSEDKYCPWEDSEQLGAFEAFKQTVAGVLLR